MKTIKTSFFACILLVLITAVSINAEAQSRRKSRESEKTEKNIGRGKVFESDRHQGEKRNENRSDRSKEDRFSKYPRWKDQDYDRIPRHEERINRNNWNDHRSNSYNNWNDHRSNSYRNWNNRGSYSYNNWNGHRSDFYYHKDYGRTYRKFNSNPLIFRHHHGNYFFYDNNFCEYHPGIGYVIVDAPYNTIFYSLPFQLERVIIQGITYFTYDNLYFLPDDGGFRLVPLPW